LQHAAMSTNGRGTFVVIEGLDRSGKSTQAAALVAQLERMNVPAKLIKFPDRTTPIGKMIDAYLHSESELDDHAIHLLFAANRWELKASIEETLSTGTTIICDRYSFSGVAYSTAKGLHLQWCRAPEVSLPAPDLTLFLDLSPEKAKERGGYGEERYEKEEMQTRVRAIFGLIARELNESGVGKWITIDAGKELETVKANIWRAIEPFLTVKHGPIGKLWETRTLSAFNSNPKTELPPTDV